jgi:DNA-binding NarL/FixJ family response regulator
LKIIIADDQRHARKGLRALLLASLPKPEIWEATTGREAERLAEQVHPHLILMDIRMPELDGLSATRSIKASQPDVKVLVLSLHGCCAEDAIAAGADAFVSKGESPERLLVMVSTLVPPEADSAQG